MEKNLKDYNFIYFIESHKKEEKVEVNLSSECPDANCLELINQINKKNHEGIYFNVNLYRFKIVPNKKAIKKGGTEIVLEIKNKKGEIFTSHININHIYIDFYIYNLSFEKNKGFFIKSKPPISLDLSPIEQFIFYKNYLRQSFSQKTLENNNFIVSTHELFSGEGQNYDFAFYLIVLLECYETYLIQKHFSLFKLSKINRLNPIPEAELVELQTIFESFGKQPENFLNFIETEEDKEKMIKIFHSILLYFTFNYQKEKICEILSKEEILKDASKDLISFREKYQGLKLDKNQISKLVEKVESLDDLNIILSYNNYFIDILDIIIDNIYQFYQKILEKSWQVEKGKKSDKNKNKIFINMDNLVQPRKNDKMIIVYEKIKSLLNFEEEIKMNLVYFSSDLFEKYIEIYEKDKDFDSLFTINSIVNTLREKGQKIEFKGFNLEKRIHQNGINLSSKGMMNNLEILNFIQKDPYYQSDLYLKKSNRPLDILTKIDISLIDDNFLEIWNKIKWLEIFQYDIKGYYKKVLSLINHIKDFDLVFKLVSLNEDNNNNNNENIAIALSYIQQSFNDLYQKTYSKNLCPNFIKDTALLIYEMDRWGNGLENFIKKSIESKIEFDVIVNIYIFLIKNYKYEISDNFITLFNSFFNNNIKNVSINIILSLLTYCIKAPTQVFTKLSNYSLKKEDFFTLNENENYNLFSELLNQKLFYSVSDLQSSDYVKNTLATIAGLAEDIKKGYIYYNEINKFNNEEQKKKLYSRLFLLSLNDKKETDILIDILEKNISMTNKVYDEYQILLTFFQRYFPLTRKIEIDEIVNILKKIKNEKFSFTINLYNKYEKDMNDYLKEAEKGNSLWKSGFYREIYQIIKSKNNEVESYKKSFSIFNEIKNLLSEDILHEYTLMDIHSYLKNFKNRQNDINNENDFIINFFSLKESNKEKFLQYLFVLSEVDEIIKTINITKSFIEKTGVIKTDYFQNIEKIILYLSKIPNISEVKEFFFIINRLELFKKEEYNICIRVISHLLKKSNFIDFIYNINIEECYKSREEDDIDPLPKEIVSNLENLVTLLKNISQREDLKKMVDSDLMSKLKNELKKNIYIEQSVNNLVNNYTKLKMFFNETLATPNKFKFIFSRINDLEKELENAKKNMKAMNEVIEEQGKKISEQGYEIRSQGRRINEQENEIRNHENSINNLKNIIGIQERKIDDLEDKIRKQEISIDGLSIDINSLEGEISRVRSEIPSNI